MFPQVKLLATIVTILIYYLSEIHGGVLDKSHVSKSSTVRHTVNSMEVSTKINPTLPLILPQTKLQSNTHLIPKNIVEATSVKRKGKIFSDLSFLTGLGIGSLATSAIIPSGTKLSSSGISERLQSPTIPSLVDLPTATISTQPLVSTTGQQFPLGQTGSHDLAGVFDQTHPYYLAFSNNNLLYQALRSMQEILDRLKAQPKESLNVESSFAPPAPVPTPSSSFIADKQSIAWNSDVSNELNESDGTSEVRVIKKSDEQIGIFNCSALKDIIRETIKESNVFNEKRQANEMMNETSTESNTMMPDVTTTTIPSSTTQIPPPQSTTIAGNFGYYGGHGQNLSGISFVSHPYPSTSYGYPNPVHNAYGPPIYPSETFHHSPHHHQQHQEYYNPEIVDEYPSDALINSGNHFSSVSDQWPIYPPFAKARKLSRADNNKLIIGGNGFVPSRKLG